MIARDILLFLLLIILPFLYIDLRWFKGKKAWWKRLLWWVPCVAMTAYCGYLAMERDFIPGNDRIFILYGFLFLLGLIIIPMWTFLISSSLGKGCSWIVRKCKKSPRRKPRNYGNLLGVLSVPVVWFILFWGTFVGFNKLEVNHTDYISKDLPKAFDGYRIVLFSDAHVGSYQKHNSWLLQCAVDSINAQKPDMIIFAGDLQNIQPQELYPHIDVLGALKAKDGIYSVLGNHDYAEYIGGDEAIKAANCKETVSLERQMGWNVLLNEHCTIERDKDHIILAGMENDGDGKRFPQKGDINKTLENVAKHDFILMLEHDPSAWRRKIVKDGRSQLTLSGHTHKMQFSLFDWCPLSLTGKEFNGWYQEGSQQLFVTAGLGGLIPFRFGATGEIVVLTLRSH
jgi:predicted MPP superfamily phosphohydrolase